MALINKHPNKNPQSLIKNADVEKKINCMEPAHGYSV